MSILKKIDTLDKVNAYENDMAKIVCDKPLTCELQKIFKPKSLANEDNGIEGQDKRFSLLFSAFKEDGFTVLRKKKDENGNFVMKYDEETNTQFVVNEKVNLGNKATFFVDVYGKDTDDLNTFKFSFNEGYEYTSKHAPLMLRIAEKTLNGQVSGDIYSFELDMDAFVDEFVKIQPLTLNLFTVEKKFLIDGKIPKSFYIWDAEVY